MDRANTALAMQVETVAELRELYRAAEARAARMRLMSTSGRQLALAEVVGQAIRVFFARNNQTVAVL